MTYALPHGRRRAVTCTTRARGRVALVLVAALSLLVVGGCGNDTQRIRDQLNGGPERLPATPNAKRTPPVPALLDTVGPYRAPANFGPAVTATWQLVSMQVNGQTDLTFRVPTMWIVTGDGRAENADGTVDARVRITTLRDSNVSLATYAARLADGAPLAQYLTSDGHVVYATSRTVSLAPSDPDVPEDVYHTAVISIDGRNIKLDVHYRSTLDWRFSLLGRAVIGTLSVLPHQDAP